MKHNRVMALVATLTAICVTTATLAAPAATANTPAAEVTASALPEFVIAGFGDSYGSGEGAPHTAGSYVYSGLLNKWIVELGKKPALWTPNGTAEDRRCHRSPNSGLNQAALLLAAAFQGKARITFRNFACSGGAIRSGISAVNGEVKTDHENGGVLTPYLGMGSERVFDPEMPSQVEQANAWRSSIDAAMVNVGGNDAGFGRMLFLCAVNWHLLGLLSVGFGGLNECAEYKNGTLLPAPDAQRVINLLSGPTSYVLSNEDLKGAKPGPTESKTQCTALTMDDAAAGRCTPVLAASYELLAKAARGGVAPATYVRCTPDETIEAIEKSSSDAIGSQVTVSTGATCEKRLGGWAKMAFQYPKFTNKVPHIYLNTYPQGAITDSAGALCNQTGNDPLTWEIRAAEADLFQSVMVKQLNALILSAAATHSTTTSKWTAVPVANTTGHGVCASAGDRWFNTNRDDGLKKMGEEKRNDIAWWLSWVPGATVLRTAAAVSSGWAHPNAKGFKNIYAYAIANQIRPQICAKFNLTPCPRIAGNPAGSLDGDVFGKVRSIDSSPVAATVTLTQDGTVIAQTTSNASTGTYSFANVPIGTYDVTATSAAAWPPLAPRTLGVYVGSNQQKEVNLTLDIGAKITGRVNLPSGAPAPGVTVHAYLSPVNYPTQVPDAPTATAVTDGSGTYTFPSLAAATLARLHVVPSPGPVAYKSLWYKNASRWQSAQTIPLEESYNVTADTITLEEGLDTGTIMGTAYTDGGYGAWGARVTAFSATLGQVAQTRVEDDGTFELEDVPVGPTTVLFDTSPGHDWYSFQPRWYPGTPRQAEARVVDVVAGQTHELDDVDVPFGADITVETVDEITGDPVPGVEITLVGDGGSLTGKTNKVGIVLFEGLPTGSYKVGANPDPPYLREWFEWSGSFATATVIEAESAFSGSRVPIGLEKVPADLEVTLTREANRSVTLTWRASVGADYVQIQRRIQGQRRFVNVITGQTGTTYNDASTSTVRSDNICFRFRAKAVTGATGAWIMDCTY